ncbi:MAG TPA: AgmX/PglI C-terminal domain-containing protein [Kofleriaceae bacterium]|nr:AgmX/PglI C-terminal domain-containing protein [Kofleriaceae bacterium]
MPGHEATPTEAAGSGSGSASPAAMAGDVSFELPPIEIKGVVFQPEAIYAPSMMLYYPKRKTTLEKQRTVFQTTKDTVQKQAQAAVLATLLYDKAKTLTDDNAKNDLYKEALQALSDAAQASGDDKVDDITLRLIGRYALMLNPPDYPTAEKAWQGLVTRFPKEKDADDNKGWLGYTLLMEYKNADALAAVKDAPLSEKHPELAYVIAWAKFRAGDSQGAWQALTTAAKGWGDLPHDPLERDIQLFAGRTNVSVKDAFNELLSVSSKGKGPDVVYSIYANLGLFTYQYAGRWADAVQALQLALDSGAKIPPEDIPTIKYRQADFTVRLDDPVTAAKYALQALQALPACAGKCTPQDAENVVESVHQMARLFHILYATANDVRYYQPAHDLYAATIPLLTANKQLHDQGAQDFDTLERTFKAMKAGKGTHDKQALGVLLERHNQEIQACYELGLLSNPKLAGTVVVNLESDQTGVVKGAATDPKAGMADLSMVAGCAADRVRHWKLPTRAQAGSTRIKLVYTMAPRSHDKGSAGGTATGANPKAP